MTPNWKLRGTLEDILEDINEYYCKSDADYFVDCWKTLIEHTLNEYKEE